MNEPIVRRIAVQILGIFNLQKFMTYKKKKSSKKHPSKYSMLFASNASDTLCAVATLRYPRLMTGMNRKIMAKCTEIPLCHRRTNMEDRTTDKTTIP
jgi:hypothetical protein